MGGVGSKTEIMPPGAVVPDLGISRERFASRRQRRRLGIGLVATIVAVIAFVQLRGSGDDLVTVPTTTTAPIAYLTVDPNALIGLTSATASDVLSASGFVVVTDPATGPDLASRVVTGVEPSGQVPAGTTVTLHIAPAAAPTPSTTVEDRKGKKEKPPKNDDG